MTNFKANMISEFLKIEAMLLRYSEDVNEETKEDIFDLLEFHKEFILKILDDNAFEIENKMKLIKYFQNIKNTLRI